jgi:Ca2+-binding EF-hand superfamily protein
MVEQRLEDGEIRKLIKKFDADGDGQLNFHEFKAFVKHMQSL